MRRTARATKPGIRCIGIAMGRRADTGHFGLISAFLPPLLLACAAAGCGSSTSPAQPSGTGGIGDSDGSGGGGSDGGASSAPSDAIPAFDPCPRDGTPCAVMPLGDSITDGSSGSGGGYRVELFRQALANHQLITFVGSLTNGPTTVDGQPFPMSHEGHSGYAIDNGGGRVGLSTVVDQALASHPPHIILLMIGTNDVDLSIDLGNAPARLGALLDRINNDAPDALLAITTILPTRLDTENLRVQAYNDAIPALVQERIDAGKHVVLVDNNAAFSAVPDYANADMSDNLHPNDAGYVVIGQTWYAAVGSLFPPAP
jgi:lysophospholipase L1-like esterase